MYIIYIYYPYIILFVLNNIFLFVSKTICYIC